MPETARPCAPFLAAPCRPLYTFVKCGASVRTRRRPHISLSSFGTLIKIAFTQRVHALSAGVRRCRRYDGTRPPSTRGGLVAFGWKVLGRTCPQGAPVSGMFAHTIICMRPREARSSLLPFSPPKSSSLRAILALLSFRYDEAAWGQRRTLSRLEAGVGVAATVSKMARRATSATRTYYVNS